MSQLTMLKRNLFAVANAISAVAILTTPAPAQADPTIPLAPACKEWRFNGAFYVNHSNNGWAVHLNTDDNRRLTGFAQAFHNDWKSFLRGTVEGDLLGREIHFTTHWNNGSIGVYDGLVYERGTAQGTNYDRANPGATDTWASDFNHPLVCAVPGSETPPAAAAPPRQSNTSNGCIAGYVPRLARPGDKVCVTPAVAERTAQENANPPLNREPGGVYGPDTCKQGFVWREAFDGDTMCVPPEIRTQTLADNAAAASRKAN